MAASHKPQDGFCFGPTDLTEFEQTILYSNFDSQCDFDLMDIVINIQEENKLRKVCIYKILLFCPEFILTKLIFGEQAADYKRKATKLFWQFYRKKITIENFRKELTTVMNNGNII